MQPAEGIGARVLVQRGKSRMVWPSARGDTKHPLFPHEKLPTRCSEDLRPGWILQIDLNLEFPQGC